jgi:hypothetical protein
MGLTVNAALPTRPDMLLEIGAHLIVTTYTPRADAHMARYWRDSRVPGQVQQFVLPTLWLDPLVTKATEDGLTLLVRQGTH